jgi:hypothetical protein
VVKKKRQKIHEAVIETIASTPAPCLESYLIARLEHQFRPQQIRKAVNDLIERGLVERVPYHDAFPTHDSILRFRFAMI